MNSIGRNFRLTIYGESHGSHIGIIIDGCPSGIHISDSEIERELQKRRPGKKGTTTRVEHDEFQIISGVFQGYTTGSAINIMINNNDKRSKDYRQFKKIPRPGHADYSALIKYDRYNDFRGGGMFSGRMTAALVAAGAIAKKIIMPITINASIVSIGGKEKYDQILQKAIEEGDSLGGIITCKISNVPVGIGEPFFNSIESEIAKIVFAIPAIKGIEFGAGFNSSNMLGSEFNDSIINSSGKTKTNNSGGINGGISNGNDIEFRVAVRPTASIAKKQETFNFETEKVEAFQIKGRHDACIALRVPPIIESVAAVVLADLIK